MLIIKNECFNERFYNAEKIQPLCKIFLGKNRACMLHLFCLEIVRDLSGKMVNYAGNFVYEILNPFTHWFKLKALTQTELWRNLCPQVRLAKGESYLSYSNGFLKPFICSCGLLGRKSPMVYVSVFNKSCNLKHFRLCLFPVYGIQQSKHLLFQ